MGISESGKYSKYYVDEVLRLEIKSKAEEVRYRWSKKGFTDIFDIVNEKALLIKKPFATSGVNHFSGFSTYLDEHFILFINTAYTLGHQRFTAAHELYHLEFDADFLTRCKVVNEDDEENEQRANVFASEFLMPEDAIKEYFLKHLNGLEIRPYHVVRMHNLFKVSYKAMLVKLFQFGYIVEAQFEKLKKMGRIEEQTNLLNLTKKQGFNTDLILPTNDSSIPDKFIHYIIDNYDNKKISYGRLEGFLEFIGSKPEEFEIYPPCAEEID
jgi:Zn-dependent peptidase ImmA (M78 family)